MVVENLFSFSITDKNGKTNKFEKDHYCFQGNSSFFYLFYSNIENVWVVVLINGWIKINGKVVEKEAVYFNYNCVIEFEEKSYILTSHKKDCKGCSKILTETISTLDVKKISKKQVLYFLEEMKVFELEDISIPYNILQYNPVFNVEKDFWSLNYFVYSVYNYSNINRVLFEEYRYKTDSKIQFILIDLKKDFILENRHNEKVVREIRDTSITKFNYVEKNFVYAEFTLDVLSYIYMCIRRNLNLKIHFTRDIDEFEVYRQWIQIYFTENEGKNQKKRRLNDDEEYSLKRKCIYKEIIDSRYEQVCNVLDIRNEKRCEERACFSSVGSEYTYTEVKNKSKRSYSLIEDNDREERSKFWLNRNKFIDEARRKEDKKP